MADIIEKDEQHNEEEELEIVENEEELPPSDDDSQDDDSQDDDSQDDDSQEDEDERIKSEEDDEREAIRERRRQEKKERKERRENAIKRDKLELDFLRKRNDDLERRITAQETRSYHGDLSAFDQQIAKVRQDAQTAERIIAKAVEAGNGEDVAQAMRYRDEALQKAQQLVYQKQQAAQRAPKPKQNQIDDMTMQYAKEFIKENPWYDAQGGNEDSAVVIAIDQTITREGFDPRSEEYWSELRKRAAKRLPERFGKTSKREVRGGPAVGSGKEHAPATTRKQVYISPERKQALIEAGVWDDPVLRMKYVKRYAEYDKQHKNS